jgi:hypothetical protein
VGLKAVASQNPASVSITGGTIGGSSITSQGIVTILGKGAGATGAADTNENTLATITVPANAMGANGGMRIKANFTVTSSANNKTLRIRFSGASGTQYVNDVRTAVSAVTYEIWIANLNNTSSQKSFDSSAVFPGTTAVINGTTSAVDTTAATTVVITGQKASAGETITLNWYSVELISNGA